jgi:hypothetical protein
MNYIDYIFHGKHISLLVSQLSPSNFPLPRVCIYLTIFSVAGPSECAIFKYFWAHITISKSPKPLSLLGAKNVRQFDGLFIWWFNDSFSYLSVLNCSPDRDPVLTSHLIGPVVSWLETTKFSMTGFESAVLRAGGIDNSLGHIDCSTFIQLQKSS